MRRDCSTLRTVKITQVQHSQFENMQSLSCQKYITFSGLLHVGGIFTASLLLNLGFHDSMLTRLSLGFEGQIEFRKTFERINLFPQIIMFLGL
jgi:hypothetical protein